MEPLLAVKVSRTVIPKKKKKKKKKNLAGVLIDTLLLGTENRRNKRARLHTVDLWH